ncbi:Ubiquinone biosynthesis O-methyltransferase [subsurface metagenome]
MGTVKVVGLDVETEALVKAKARGIETYCTDLNDSLPFAEENFDVIHANQVIEHLSNTDLFIKEIHRILRPRGYAVIATPNLASLPNIAYLLLGIQPYDASVSDEVIVGSWHPIKVSLNSTYPMGMLGHRRLFTLRALKGLFEYYGFEVEKAIGCGYYPLPTILAHFMSLVDKKHCAYIVIKVRKMSERCQIPK